MLLLEESLISANNSSNYLINKSNFTSSGFIPNNSSILNVTQHATTVISQIDPNWFYSSSAQSAAAIVGLMGAFVTTKILTTKSFVSQLQREIVDCQNKIDSINSLMAPKIKYIKDLDYESDCKLIDEFLEDSIPFIDPNNPPDLEALYEMAIGLDEYQDINKEALKEKYDNTYLAKVKEYADKLVDKFLEAMSSEIDPDNPPTIDELFKFAEEKEEYELIHKSVLEERYTEYLRRTKTKSSLGYISFIPDIIMRSLNSPLFQTSSSSALLSSVPDINPIKWDRYRRYKEEVAEKKAELLYYEHLLEDKKMALSNSKQDLNDLRRNIVALFALSITGIFFPLFMMLLDPELMMKYRVLTFIVILLGWIGVVVHLAAEIWNLFKSSEQ